ncbi:hypothetical protein ACVWZ8_002367 [Arthrobacter sp. UYCu723]
MAYNDINPHRSKPTWPAYLGLAVLAVATVCIVALALAR